MNISIITPVFNQVHLTKQYIKDLSYLGVDTEIIIINNGSTDKTKEYLDNLNKENIKIIHSDTNLGFAKASNLGYKKSNGDIVVFLNNDIRVIKENWVDLFIDNLQDNEIISPTGGLLDKNFNFVYETEDNNKEFNYLSGWCLAGKRNTFEKFRIKDYCPFIEEFGTYFEDTFMGYEAKRLGVNMRIVEKLPIVHLKRQTSKTMNLSNMYKEARQKFMDKIGV